MQSQEKEKYTFADCLDTRLDSLLEGKVIVIHPKVAAETQQGQVHFCYTDTSPESTMGKSVSTISLSTGERCHWYRVDVLGDLKPELLSDEAKLYLSQSKLNGTHDLENPQYHSCYYLEDGCDITGNHQHEPQEVREFAMMQASY
jgi:hypothetical protein